ncbi:MAG: tripartite tricarboxylate transporter substrate binding protein [Hyphomicrobiales bacterium]|nr:tripartite tricarboxylate transporter substrate binding protein [Hyphomicrobiales bacterium]MBV8825316.1 tripartite tricarboxylate transporter substrate binding protein [Hyphomicrobiales bacterium]
MKFARRQLLRLTASAAAIAVVRFARAETYPSRPVRVIVPFAAGGSTDFTARLIAQRLSERFGQQFVVENRSGASTNIATQVVVRAPADGYTLLLVTPPSAINATLYKDLPFNFLRDIAPVASVIRAPYIMEINPALPAKTVPEFIAYVKANPGKVSMASAGVGTGPHLTGELLMMATGIEMTHVPYRGGAPALNDLMGGQVQLFFASAPETIEFIKAGKVRALAVTSASRAEVLAGLPTLDAFVPGFEASYWTGFGAPKNTPPEIIDSLNREINAALTDPALQARFHAFGATELVGSPADFRGLIAEQTEKWGKVIKSTGIKPE